MSKPTRQAPTRSRTGCLRPGMPTSRFTSAPTGRRWQSPTAHGPRQRCAAPV